jgi:hypothetical protein
MKIDFKKIINIKNKKDLSKYKLDKPIFLNNYLFHYLIIFKNLKGLKLYKFPIYMENNFNLNGIQLAAKEYDFDILCYLIETYPDYIYNKNKYDYTFINYIPLKEINKFMIKYPNIDWIYLIDPEPSQLIDYIILELNYKELKKFFLLFNYKPNNICPYIFFITRSYNLNIKEKILLLDNFTDKELNIKYYGQGILLYIYYDKMYNNKELIIYLINRNVDFNYFDFKNDNPLYNIIKYDICNNKNELSLLLLDKLKNKNIFDKLDINLCNILHIVLITRLLNKNIKFTDYKIDEYIIKLANNNNLNQKNIYLETPLELMSLLDYDIYSKFLLNIKINKKNLNRILDNKWTQIFNESPNKKWYNFLNTFPNYNDDDNNDNDIILLNYKHVNYNLFNNMTILSFIYFLNLGKKYDFLYIPIIKNHKLNKLSHVNNWLICDKNIYNNFIYPWVIVIKSETEYFIHPYLNNLINSVKNNKKYKYSFVDIFIVSNTLQSAHANCLIYDFEKLTIERFEPYGNSNNYYIDDILEEMLTWNTGFTYINPILFSPDASFQSISQENIDLNKPKFGDLDGYCLAWCIWYIESRIINNKIESKILINKLIKKINNLINITFIDYIRNYANELNNEKNIFLKKINFDENKINNKHYNDDDYRFIIENIEKYYL